GPRELCRFHSPAYSIDTPWVARRDCPPPRAVVPARHRRTEIKRTPRGGFLASLNDHKISSFHLGHHSRKDGVNQGVNTRVPRKVMRNVNLKTLMGRNRRSKGMDQ